MAEVRTSIDTLHSTLAMLTISYRTPVPHSAAFLEDCIYMRSPASRADHDSMLPERGNGVAYTATK